MAPPPPTAAEVDSRSGYCAATSTFHSKRRPVDLPADPDVSLPSFLYSRCAQHNSKIAFVDAATGRTLTYRSLFRAVEGVAAALASPPFSLRKGDVVFLLSPNSLHFPVAVLAALSIGAVLTTTNPLNTPADIAKQAKDANPAVAFVTADLLPKIPDSLAVPIVLLCDDDSIPTKNDRRIVATIDALAATAVTSDRRDRVRQDDPATLLYSSGTTGPSKGVVSTHRNLIAMAGIIIKRFESEGWGEPQTFLCTVPMFHIYGLCAFATGLLGSGATIVIMSKFDLKDMLSAIIRHKVTYLPLVPPILVVMAASPTTLPLGRLQRVLSGGAPLSKELIEGFSAKYPGIEILQGYGLTESCGIGASTDSAEESSRYGTAGLLSPNTLARIVDADTGELLPVNRTGELWIKGPYVMKEYYRNPEATRATLNSEGWLRTGDLCYFDDDGYLFVVDRLKELIKYKGYQVPPAELEALLLTHPEIADAAVIPYPDKEGGQVPMACVVRKSGSGLSDGEVMSFVANQVAPYKKVRRVAFVSAIPKNPSGKILRKDLLALALAASKL